jgi:hypothetical protein
MNIQATFSSSSCIAKFPSMCLLDKGRYAVVRCKVGCIHIDCELGIISHSILTVDTAKVRLNQVIVVATVVVRD